MAGERGYTLSEDAARRTGNAVRWVEGQRKPEVGGLRRRPIMDDAGGLPNCTRVRFQILVADSASRSALCHIMARQYGCGVSDIPGTLFDGLVIEVCDPSGCFFNETEDSLVGREGWAEYVLPISGASHCQSGDTHYYLTEEWEVFSLCCATQACQL